MVTQLLIAYGAGMGLAIGMEIAKVLKARNMNRRAAMQTAIAPVAAPSFDSTPRVDHAPGRPRQRTGGQRTRPDAGSRIEQIILLRNRFAIARKDVNLLFLVDVERIHTL